MKLIDYLIELRGRFEIRILPLEPGVPLTKEERDARKEWLCIIHVEDRFNGNICHAQGFISRKNQDDDFIKAIVQCVMMLKDRPQNEEKE